MTLLTEDEARTKWCPLARVGTAAGNRYPFEWDTMTGPFAKCIASDCMAWRAGVWDHQRNLTPENRTPGVGYCGAFGKPS